MPMIMCPECGTSISDRAVTCPYCGYTADDSSKSIALQESYEAAPRFEVELERWNPKSNSSTLELTEVSHQDARRLFSFFSNWKVLQTTAPALTRLLKESVGEDQVKLMAKLPEHVMQMVKEGKLRLVLDKSGEILPTVYGPKGAFQQARLEWEHIPPDITNAFQHLETQTSIALVLAEVQSLHEEMRDVRVDLQNDRLALADSAWDKLVQARIVEDTRLREALVMQAISSATDAKRTLMRNFTENLRYLQLHSNKGLLNPDTLKDGVTRTSRSRATDASQDLISITNAVRVEGEGYTILGQNAASQECLNQFKEFIEENHLDNRDTLLLINSNLASGRKALEVVNRFEDIVHRITTLDKAKELDKVPKELLEPYQSSNAPDRINKRNDDRGECGNDIQKER